MRPKSGQNQVNVRSKSVQNRVKIGSKSGQNHVKIGSKSGQNQVKIGPKRGKKGHKLDQNRVKNFDIFAQKNPTFKAKTSWKLILNSCCHLYFKFVFFQAS